MFLLTGALFLTSKTNPGTTPVYWGFHIGDEEFKKKDIAYYVKFLNQKGLIIVQYVIYVF
jgi:hypothetical protein